jgi:phosphotransacetylase
VPLEYLILPHGVYGGRGYELQRTSDGNHQQQRTRSRLRENLSEGSIDMDALLMDAQTKLRRGECASSMVQRECSNDAELKDAQDLLKREAYASGMGQRENTSDVAMKGA